MFDKVFVDFIVFNTNDNVLFQFLLLGAVPFPKDVPRLKRLGVGGVITLNEPYETLVPSSLYFVRQLSLYDYIGFWLQLAE